MNLSNAENAVAFHIRQGLTNAEIANSLSITAKTVKFHLTSIFKKYDVKNRNQLLLKLGIEPLEQFKEKQKIYNEVTSMESKSLVIGNSQKSLEQQEKIKFIDQQFKVGDSINQLHKMMKEVTKDEITPATVNAACNCVARLNETINTAIQAAKFLNER